MLGQFGGPSIATISLPSGKCIDSGGLSKQAHNWQHFKGDLRYGGVSLFMRFYENLAKSWVPRSSENRLQIDRILGAFDGLEVC